MNGAPEDDAAPESLEATLRRNDEERAEYARAVDLENERALRDGEFAERREADQTAVGFILLSGLSLVLLGAIRPARGLPLSAAIAVWVATAGTAAALLIALEARRPRHTTQRLRQRLLLAARIWAGAMLALILALIIALFQ